MTAIAAIRRTDGLYLLSDGASYSADGVLRKIAPKVILLPQCPAAMATRGSTMVAANLLAIQAGGLSTFDELIEYLPIGLKVATELAGPLASLSMGGGHTEVIACGWSTDRDAPEIWVVGNRDSKHRDADDNLVEQPAYLPVKWSAPYLGTLPDPDLCKEFGFGLPEDVSQFDPNIHGFNWFQALRRQDADVEFFPEAAGIKSVGGFYQVTSIYRHGLDSRILHRWPDKVGQPITPR